MRRRHDERPLALASGDEREEEVALHLSATSNGSRCGAAANPERLPRRVWYRASAGGSLQWNSRKAAWRVQSCQFAAVTSCSAIMSGATSAIRSPIACILRTISYSANLRKEQHDPKSYSEKLVQGGKARLCKMFSVRRFMDCVEK